eukprot:TRINITY_DN5937_c0_g1_i4.p1 TRINITY_DN5937_c0_g1~~TRINITY_DN5937_c0_g1_i4.p1  ORF type:complete len:499 (-),score=122.19 TRINITY_DN5937_c0_g1_i4:604-2100(-)
MNFEGENISLKDALFVDNITGDIETFRIRSESIARVLIFPPVSNYHRFLIHKVVETGFPQFTTFSVGEGIHRRTVVCFQLHLVNHTLSQNSSTSYPLKNSTPSATQAQPPIQSLAPKSNSDTPAPADSTNIVEEILAQVIDCVGKNSNTNNFTTCDTEDLVKESTKPTGVDEMTAEDHSLSNSNYDPALQQQQQVQQQSPTKDPDGVKRKPKRPAQAVYVPPRGRHGVGGGGAGNQQQAIDTCSPPAKESPTKAKTKSAKKSSNKSTKEAPNAEECAQESAEEGKENNCNLDVTEQIVSEISAAVGGVQIEEPTIDYLSFQTSDSSINIDQFGHVIELYDFPSSYKTTDLISAFPAFTSRWDIKWVDDTHALGVFSSCESAAEALAVRHPSILTRPLNMATLQSKIKAKSLVEELLPYKPRPVSCTAPARRLLQRALGSTMRVPEASKLENDRLREAQKKKEEDRRKGGLDEERRKRREVEERGRGDKKYRFGEHDDR